MSIHTYLRLSQTPTAAKLQRLWARSILDRLLQNIGAWPSSTVEWRLRRYGAGAVGRSVDLRQLTSTEASIDRLRASVGVSLWVDSQLRSLGALRYDIAHKSYVQELTPEEIGTLLQQEPKVVLGHRLATARYLNRCIRQAEQQAGLEAVA